MKKNYFILLVLTVFAFSARAQEWTLKLRSSVELRTFKLTDESDISESKLPGATITLFKGSSLISQIQSDGNGDFIIDVPANGDFILTVSYSGCNSKKFAINTTGVPEEVAKDNYKPSFGIEGVIMAKAFPTIDYSILKQPLVRIKYVSNGKKFDDEEVYTRQILSELSRVKDEEDALIERFTTTNKTGDIALNKGDCPLAKSSYEKAMTIIPGESYPGVQLPKVGDCLKNKDQAAKKSEEEAAAKALAAKLAADKLAAEKLAKEKAEAEKVEADRVAKEKVEADKTLSAKLAAEKAETDRLAKEKSAAEKLEADRLAKEKAETDKTQSANLAAEKSKAERLSKEKANVEKAEADRLANEKANLEKTQKDKAAKEKADAEKIARQKIITEKDQAEKIAKEKAEAARIAKEKTTTPVKEPIGIISPTNSGSEPSETGVNNGDAKYSIPQALGADKYKGTIKRADELFKMKRYAEAKPMYEDALKQKPNDPYANNKLTEIEKLIKK